MKTSGYNNIPKRISNIRHLINEYLVYEMEQLGMKNIVPSHGDILFTLFMYKEMTLKDLAEKIRRDKSTVTALIKKLEKMGYISLKVNEADKRSRFICLTKKGKSLEEPFKEISKNMSKILLKDMEDKDKAILSELLDKMEKNFMNELFDEV